VAETGSDVDPGGLGDPWDTVLRLWQVANVDLPTPDVAANEGGLVYDSTLNLVKYSDGAAWIGLEPYDATLAALAGLNSSAGILVQTAADTFTKRTLQAPAAGFSITNPAGTAGDPTFALTNDLAALEGLSSTGIAVRTGTSTWAQRTLTAPAAGITVTDGDGGGNPTLVLANDLAALEALSGTSTIYYRSATSTWTAVTIGGNLGFSAGTLGSSLGTAATAATGTSGTTVPLLDGANTWSGANTFNSTFTLGNATGPALTIGTNRSAAAWGNSGLNHRTNPNTLTDTSTAAAGTVAGMVANSYGTPTFAATNAMTATHAATMYIAGAPAAGSNMTLTNAWALRVASGDVSIVDNLVMGGVVKVGANQVVGARKTGWTAATGTAARTTWATHTAQVISASPTQAQVQSIDDDLVKVSPSGSRR
jgi:hypothetical protein